MGAIKHHLFEITSHAFCNGTGWQGENACSCNAYEFSKAAIREGLESWTLA